MIPSTNRPASSLNLDLSFIKADSQKRLFKLLHKFEGNKAIVFDDKLIGPFDFVASASLLKKNNAKPLYRLSNVRLPLTVDTEHNLFFLRKNYQVARLVASVLQRADRDTLAKTSLIFIPQRCASLEKVLEQNKLDLSRLNSIDELDLEFFALDTDLLSMENEFVYRDIYLNQDYSAIHQIVEGLVKFQDIYGQIPRIAGQGEGAKLVCDLLLRRRKLQPCTNTSSPQVHQLVLIDRRVDLLTPLLTQITYEGLIDEVFGIQHGTIVLPAEKFEQPSDAKQEKEQKDKKPTERIDKRIELRSSEDLYARLRDCHINAVGETLKQSSKQLQAEYEECNSEGKAIHEMGKIVKRLQQLKVAKTSQATHIAIAELVNEQISKNEFIYGLRIEHELLQEDRINRVIPELEDLLLRQVHPMKVLRLICIQSIINNGLKPKICDYYKREIIQNYGDDFLLFLMQLEKANVLLSPERFHKTGVFGQLNSKFNLINDSFDERNLNHLSYVYGGYSPLSVMVAKALAQYAQGTQWRSISESLKLLPEPTVTHSDFSGSAHVNHGSNVGGGGELGGNILTSSAVAAASLLLSSNGANSTNLGLRVRRNSATSSQSSSEDTRTVLVFFIGGCTFAEISALRFLSQQDENNCEFLIGTTKIINGKSFLKSLCVCDARKNCDLT